MLTKIQSIPPGFEYLDIQKSKKLNEYKEKIRVILESQNFVEFLPPLMDYTELFSFTYNNNLMNQKKKLFEIKDANGERIAIRSDLTVMAMKSFLFHKNQKSSVQYYYIQPVFRDIKKGSGYSREIYQVGVEWIGNFNSRIENLYELAKKLLELFSIDYVFVFGNAQFLKKLLSYIPLKIQEEVLIGFYYKNIDFLKEITEKYKIHQDLKAILVELPLMIGDKKIIQELAILLKNFPELSQIVYETDALINDHNILYDFSLVKEFSYYTGITYDVFSIRNNSKILTGGIYDNFSLQFSDWEIPSCGFAMNLSEIINQIEG